MADCSCPDEPSSAAPRRPRPRMGVSSLGNRAPVQFSRQLPLSMPIPPRPASPPRQPRTVPGLSRGSSKCSSCDAMDRSLDKTLSPGSADRTLRPPDLTNYQEAMEELTKLEYVERKNVAEDVTDFQKKRRKLVFDVITLKMSKAKKSVKKAVSKMGL